MKKFFNIKAHYKFEWNDLRAVAMFVNVLAIIFFGYAGALVGLIIAAVGIVKDLTNRERHFNEIMLHFLGLILNSYFLLQI